MENDGTTVENYLSQRFVSRGYHYTKNGRDALNLALKYYQLTNDDVVTIYTTTGNHYISSCVTGEIEKHCQWSRKIEANTRVILVNHEFGYPYQEMQELAALGYPIIEDCAYSFLSEDDNYNIGMVGDFTIYSFPKFFPLQIGGLLTYNEDIKFSSSDESSILDSDTLNYLKKVLSNYIADLKTIAERRLSNYNWLKSKLSSLGCNERLPLDSGIVPGVYLFTVPTSIDLSKMKDFLWAKGIQCSVFYGEQAFFIPVHHRLQQEDLTYFVENIKSFVSTNIVSS